MDISGLALQELDLQIEYRPGKQNAVADALSHISPDTEATQDAKDIKVLTILWNLLHRQMSLSLPCNRPLLFQKIVNGPSYKQLMES